MKKLSLYYDVTSMHCWILFERFQQIIGSAGRLQIKFKPVHSSQIIIAAGNKIPYYTAPLKKFHFHDTRFLGRLHNLPVKTPHKEIDQLLLSTVSNLVPHYLLTLISDQYEDKLASCSRMMWNMLWVENRTIHTGEDIIEIIEKLELPASLSNDLNDDKWSKLLDARHNEALSSGCFGIPWVIVEDGEGNKETYFGQDRWPLIQRHLKDEQFEDEHCVTC